MEPNTNAPYTEEELYDLAAMEVSRHDIPESLRDDAIQEFAIAAWQAVGQAKTNPRGYQFIRGRGAMIDWCRREIDVEKAVPPQCAEGATRLSFDAPAEGSDGESTLLSETIADPNANIPGEEPSCPNDDGHIEAALSLLTPEERETAIRVLIQGQSQREAAEAMGKSRRQVQWLLENVHIRLETRMAAEGHAHSE